MRFVDLHILVSFGHIFSDGLLENGHFIVELATRVNSLF